MVSLRRRSVFCEILGFRHSQIGIGVLRVVFFGVLDVAVTLGSYLKLRLWWVGVWSERVEIIPNVRRGANFAEDSKMSRHHFSWQAPQHLPIRS